MHHPNPQVATTLVKISAMPSVIGCGVIFTEGGEVVQSDLLERTGLNVEELSRWALGIFMSSEIVAKKTPEHYGQLQFLTLVTDQGGVCVVAAGSYLIVTLTSRKDAASTVKIAQEIAQLPAIEEKGPLNFDPETT